MRARIAVVTTLALLGCGGLTSTAAAPTMAPVTVHWRVDLVTRSRSGADIDNGPLRLVRRQRGCQLDAAGRSWSRPVRDRRLVPTARVCTEAVSGTLVTRLVCGGNPWVDRVLCFDAVRVACRIEVSRYEYDVPVVDGPAPAPKLVGGMRAGQVDVGGDVVRGATEYRNIAE